MLYQISASDVENEADKLIITVDGTRYDENGRVLPPIEIPHPSIGREAVLKPLRNKKYLRTDKEVFQDYLTASWAPSDGYTIEKGTELTATIGISGSKEFTNKVKGSGMFQLSLTKSYSVQTHIPADSSRDNKLAYYADFKVYTCEIWRVEYNQEEIISETMIERGTVKEPADSYVRVVYR